MSESRSTPRAELWERYKAASTEDRARMIHEHDCPTAWDFYRRYAMGSILCPSCLLCGHQEFDRDRWAIAHVELPDIYICRTCVDAARRVKPSEITPTSHGSAAVTPDPLRSVSAAAATTPGLIADIESLDANASRAPWTFKPSHSELDSEIRGPSGIIGRTGRGTTSHYQELTNGALMVTLRNAVPEILSALRSRSASTERSK